MAHGVVYAAAQAPRTGEMLHMHSPGGSIFLREMTFWPTSWKCDIKSKIWLNRSMHIYEEHSCQISSRSNLRRQSRAFCVFWRGRPNNKKNTSNKVT